MLQTLVGAECVASKTKNVATVKNIVAISDPDAVTKQIQKSSTQTQTSSYMIRANFNLLDFPNYINQKAETAKKDCEFLGFEEDVENCLLLVRFNK